MASQKYLFRGKAVYPMLFKPDEYGGDKKWKIGVALDDDSLLLFKNSGLKLKVAPELAGFENVVTFRRPVSKMINGELVEFAPPHVEGVPEDAAIGNGSEVEVVVTVYDTRMGKGHRLESVKVNKLVEYDGKTDQRPKIITPEDIKKANTKAGSSKMNDEVPF